MSNARAKANSTSTKSGQKEETRPVRSRTRGKSDGVKLKNAAPKEEKPSVEDSTSTTSARNVLKTASASKRSSARSPSKTALLIDALGVPDGATIEQLCKVVGWQSHSVRAALTGLKKKGIVITRTKTDGKSVYAIASAPEPDASSPEVTA